MDKTKVYSMIIAKKFSIYITSLLWVPHIIQLTIAIYSFK